MNHPYEQLADLIDGTLDEAGLAGVHAHLEICHACRRDVASAAAGARAARSLPVADPPADLHRRVVTANGGRGAPTWYRWAGVAAAAAAVVAFAIALPNVGDRAAEDVAAGGTEAAAVQDTTSGAPVGVSQLDRDFDAKGLEALARSAAAERSQITTGAAESLEDSSAAIRCVSQAFGDQPTGQLTRLIRARFEGEEAYIAVYLEGPGAGEPPDAATVWAASTEDCAVLSFASADI
jgi:hypothetical protein